MGLSSAVQWWQEWQLRILVLGSLFVHFFLFFSIWVRRLPSLRWLRVFVWMAYIGGDALAIYALATLFNRNKQQASDGGNRHKPQALEVVWAPVLLIHLGGHVTISAYSLEDNELWRRHVITLVSQVTVALYVFCHWWYGEDRLLSVAVLLFVVGILKFSQKPWSLKRASFDSMQQASTSVPPRGGEAGSTAAACWTWCTSYLEDIDDDGSTMNKGRGGGEEMNLSLEGYVQEAKKCVQDTPVAGAQADAVRWSESLQHKDYIHKMFVDMPTPYPGRLSELQAFIRLHAEHGYGALQDDLGDIFDMMYTKVKLVATPLGACLQFFLVPLLALASVVLFATTHKDGYDKNDVRVTYILFCCAALQEFLVPCVVVLSYAPCIGSFLEAGTVGWHDMVSQCNIVSFCARKKKPTILMKVATFNCLREYANKHFYIGQVSAARQITQLVHRYVKDGWKEYIRDAANYRRFNNCRGNRSLQQHRQLGRLGWSLNMPFDESVLVWHIATELCFCLAPSTSPRGLDATQRSREMSNYMAYLLFIRPEMLMPGTRPYLFTVACDDIELILKDSKAPLDKEERLAREIIDRRMKSPATKTDAACRLAEALMQLEDEKERWTVIQGVWLEMLCYSAARCRGYLHAKSLGEGGEYLSSVWLLWSFMGMETLADKIQNPEPLEVEEEIAAAGASASQSQGEVDLDQTDEISSPV